MGYTVARGITAATIDVRRPGFQRQNRVRIPVGETLRPTGAGRQ
jgi:hypothetical protein